MSEKKLIIDNIVMKYLCFFIIGIILFFMSYGFFSKFSFNKEERYISNTMKSIWKVNNSCKILIDNNIDVEKALSVLPKMKADLIDISIDLNSNPSAKEVISPENYENLSKGLNENILIIEQLEAMLKNPNGSDIQLAANNLKAFRDATENYYDLIKLKKDYNYDLGVPMYSVIDSTIDYCISSNNLKKISDLKSADITKFIHTLRELVISLDSLKYNFYEDVLKCRSGNMTYELLISNIDDTSKKLASVQNILSQMSIPDDFSSLYKDFTEVVSSYNDYLYEIKYAILTEKVRRDSKDVKEDFMDSLYVSSNEAYDKIEKMYKNFTKEYNNLNSNY